MTFDASPCGWSGLLVQDGALACIADRVTLDGATLLNVEHGSARSQQCAEVLAIRVDLRLWCLSGRQTHHSFRPDRASWWHFEQAGKTRNGPRLSPGSAACCAACS